MDRSYHNQLDGLLKKFQAGKTKTLKTKSFTGILAAVAFTGIALTQTTSAMDDAWKIAMKFDIEGKGGFNTCLAFAKDLYNRMNDAGGESHIIIYDWSNKYSGAGRHAILIYRDANGRYYAMDNRTKKPVWVSGKTPEAWIKSFDRGNETKLISHKTDIDMKGRAASFQYKKSQPIESNNILALYP